ARRGDRRGDRPLRLRQVHPAAPRRRPGPPQRRHHRPRRHAADRHRSAHRGRLPGTAPAALAHSRPERRPRPAPQHRPTRRARAGAPPAAARRARARRGPPPPRGLRRHGPARLDRPGAGPQPRGAAAGRALRRAGCADSPAHAGPAARDPRRRAHHRPRGHPRRRGGAVPRRPGGAVALPAGRRTGRALARPHRRGARRPPPRPRRPHPRRPARRAARGPRRPQPPPHHLRGSLMTRRLTRRSFSALGLSSAAALGAASCVPGEGSGNAAGADGAGEWSTDALTLDWATYNPLSLVLRDQELVEAALGDGVAVTWVQSAGSNKANEFLRSGSADIASTAGSAALLARANGSPIKVIDIYSQPEWSALVVGEDSDITGPATSPAAPSPRPPAPTRTSSSSRPSPRPG